MKNIDVNRIRPQLIRKNTIIKVPPTVKVVSLSKITKLGGPQKQKQRPPQRDTRVPEPPRRQPIQSAAVSTKNLLKTRQKSKPVIRYITREPAIGSTEKILRLKNAGTNKILIIIANGPSVSEAQLDKLANINGIDTLTINKPFAGTWPTTYWAFFDQSQLRRNEEAWNAYDGIIFNSTSIKRQKKDSIQFSNIRGHGWSHDPSKGIHIGRSSTYAVMQIALWMNYSHIYIFGCDMNPAGLDGKLHHYGTNPDVDPAIRAKRFAQEAEYYDNAARLLKPEERARFTFASQYNPWPFVSQFNRADHRTIVDTILQRVLETRGQ